jgi:hypothetical protein
MRTSRGALRSAFFVAALLLWVGPAWANTYYVSNSAANGYNAGSDGNNSTQAQSKSTPWATLARAASVAGNGDTIIVNPNGTSTALTGTEYIEDSGSGYLQITQSALTLESDPGVAGGYVWMTYHLASGQRVASVNSAAGNIMFQNFVIDGSGNAGTSGTASVNGVTPHNQTGGLTFNSCVFTNFAIGQYAITVMSGSGNILTLNNCTATSTVCSVTRVAGCAYTSVTVSGGTYNNFGNMTLNGYLIDDSVGSATIGTCSITNATFSGGAYQIAAYFFSSTITTLTVTGNTWTDAQRAIYFSGLGPCTCPSITFSSNNIQGTHWSAAALYCNNVTVSGGITCNNNVCSATYGLCSITSEGANNITVNGNVINHPATTLAATDPIVIGPAGTGVVVSNNTITDAETAGPHHVILLGMDGLLVDNSNQITTTSQALGKATGSISYLDQAFTTSASTNSAHSSYIASFAAYVSSVNASPTATVACYLYSDNIGNPGTLLATATNTLNSATFSAADVATGSNEMFWMFNPPVQTTAGTKYHAVLYWNGTNSDTNYLQFTANATTTGGALQTSSNGSSWSTVAGTALDYQVFICCYALNGAKVFGNTVTLNGATNQVHCVIGGYIQSPAFYRNVVLNGAGPTLGFKGCYGGAAYSNLVYQTGGTQYAYWMKAAQNCTMYHNTAIVGNTQGYAFSAFADQSTGAFPWNTTGAIVKNNIFYCADRSSGNAGSILSLANGATVTEDYNQLYAGANVTVEAVNYGTWAALQGAGYEVHGLGPNSDPKFASYTPTNASGFTPGVGGTDPGATAGINLFTTVSQDYFSNYYAGAPTVGGVSLSRQGSELLTRSAGASTVYGVIRSMTGLVYNFATGAFETYNPLNVAGYAAYMVQQGASGVWVGPLPALTVNGTYVIDYRVQGGALPSASDAMITDAMSKFFVAWGGGSQQDNAALEALLFGKIQRFH